jgi:LysR family transcriptional regulator, glycine cleavage system transcriptional activator
VPLVAEHLASGELIEPFGPDGRLASPFSYWMIVTPASAERDEVRKFCDWIEARSALTRLALDDVPAPADITEAD